MLRVSRGSSGEPLEVSGVLETVLLQLLRQQELFERRVGKVTVSWGEKGIDYEFHLYARDRMTPVL